jgi:hypothetical protein
MTDNVRPPTPAVTTNVAPLLEAISETDSFETNNREVYDEMVRYMRLKLQKPFTGGKITMLIASGVKFLGKVKNMSGSEKKDLVLHAIRQVVNDSDYIGANEKVEILMLVDTFGSIIIDKLVEFARDAYTFLKNKAKKCNWKLSCMRPQSQVQANSHNRALSLGQNADEFDALKRYLKLKMQRPVTGPKVILMISAGVKYVEHYRNLSGTEKKDIVIRALREAIVETDAIDAEDQTMLLDFVDTFADDTIEQLVDFGKHMYLKVKRTCCK